MLNKYSTVYENHNRWFQHPAYKVLFMFSDFTVKSKENITVWHTKNIILVIIIIIIIIISIVVVVIIIILAEQIIVL